jgi:hypothetical protein
MKDFNLIKDKYNIPNCGPIGLILDPRLMLIYFNLLDIAKFLIISPVVLDLISITVVFFLQNTIFANPAP